MQSELFDVVDIRATFGAFAAIRRDGRVVAARLKGHSEDPIRCTFADLLCERVSSNQIFRLLAERGHTVDMNLPCHILA